MGVAVKHGIGIIRQDTRLRKLASTDRQCPVGRGVVLEHAHEHRAGIRTEAHHCRNLHSRGTRLHGGDLPVPTPIPFLTHHRTEPPLLLPLVVVDHGVHASLVIDNPVLQGGRARADDTLNAALNVVAHEHRRGGFAPVHDDGQTGEEQDGVPIDPPNHRLREHGVEQVLAPVRHGQRNRLPGAHVEREHVHELMASNQESRNAAGDRAEDEEMILVGPFDTAQLLLTDGGAPDGLAVCK